MIKVVKKDSTVVDYNNSKIINAINKSALRVLEDIDKAMMDKILDDIYNIVKDKETVTVLEMHGIVVKVLDRYNQSVANSYREYRNYKSDFVNMLDEVYNKAQKIMYLGDKENSNTDSALVTTKRSLIYNELNKELYNKFFLTVAERQACRDGYIYIHDKSARRDTVNCCLFDVESVMTGGFEMGNMWYNEPSTIDTACDVLGDIIMMSASMQYGGWSCLVDKVLGRYVEKSYILYIDEYMSISNNIEKAKAWAMNKAISDLEQGIQGLEYKLNSVSSSRGDYPFTTFAFGNSTDKFDKMVTEAVLKVRRNGQGKKGFKKPVLFPKLVFLYDEEIHGEGKESEYLFNEALITSSKTMYPDYLSLSGDGYVPKMYKEHNVITFPMGCRAFLSPWFENGGMYQADENDKAITIGRCNLGAITLHVPMILAKARQENKDFYEVFDYYLEMTRNLHKRTYDYISKMKASTNPLAYMEGGFYGGKLKANECIGKILKPMTMSFGITALNELQMLYNGKSIREDGEFALEVMRHLNDKLTQYKKEDDILYAVYGTPAESLCGLQVQQFRAKYGIVKGVSDKEYTTNSFHCHVCEDINAIEKQDKEYRFWDLFNGGKIQYVKYDLDYNLSAIKTLVRRAMKLGLYEGVNLSLSYCDDCGHQELNMDTCPKCGSINLTKIDRMNGYLSFSRVKGDTRLNNAKMAEISERVSM